MFFFSILANSNEIKLNEITSGVVQPLYSKMIFPKNLFIYISTKRPPIVYLISINNKRNPRINLLHKTKLNAYIPRVEDTNQRMKN